MFTIFHFLKKTPQILDLALNRLKLFSEDTSSAVKMQVTHVGTHGFSRVIGPQLTLLKQGNDWYHICKDAVCFVIIKCQPSTKINYTH